LPERVQRLVYDRAPDGLAGPAVRSAAPAGRVRAILGKIVYWLAVLALSLALLVGLVLFFESRDQSTLDMGAAGAAATTTA
jgi:hypothetical protein